MTADGNEGYPSAEDRIVAEFGDGHAVESIAARYGLSVAQVYAVVERETSAETETGTPAPPPGTADPEASAPVWPPVGYPAPAGYTPPAGNAPPAGSMPPWSAPHVESTAPGYPPPAPWSAPQAGPGGYALPDDDAIVAEYGEGYDVEAIARKHGLAVDQVYAVVQRVLNGN